MTDNSDTQTTGTWHPDIYDLLHPEDDNTPELEKDDPPPKTPEVRVKEKTGHVGLRRRGHSGHRH